MPALFRLTDTRTGWAGLSWRDRYRLLAMAALLPAVDLALRSFGMRGTQRLLGLANPHTMTQGARVVSDAVITDAQQLARLANVAGRRGLYANTCLRQALAIQWWLRRQGVFAELRIGAHADNGVLRAHAWVELDGHPLAQAGDLPPVLY